MLNSSAMLELKQLDDYQMSQVQWVWVILLIKAF